MGSLFWYLRGFGKMGYLEIVNIFVYTIGGGRLPKLHLYSYGRTIPPPRPMDPTARGPIDIHMDRRYVRQRDISTLEKVLNLLHHTFLVDI